MTFGPDNTPFDSMGGEARVRLLVDAFYDQMEAAAEFSTIRVMHPDNLDESRQKLFEFLCGWLGGPPALYGTTWSSKASNSACTVLHRGQRTRPVVVVHGACDGSVGDRW